MLVSVQFKTTLVASTPLELPQLDWFPQLCEVHQWWLAHPDMPGFSDIDPLKFPANLLKDIVVLEHTPEDRFYVRLAGTHVCELYGREIRGETVQDTCIRESRTEFEDPYRRALRLGEPLLYHREMSQWDGGIENYVLLVLPIGKSQDLQSGVLLASWDLPTQKRHYYAL